MNVRRNKGFHSILEQDHSYIHIDSCMQVFPDAEFDIAHLHGVTVYAVSAWPAHVPIAQVIENIMYWHLVAREHQNILIVDTVNDIFRAKKERKAAFLLAVQDGDFIENKLHRIEAFYRLGLRMMIPAYNASNRICAGCLDRNDGGLSYFGQLVVRECNRVGLVLDCTHVGMRSALEIIDLSAEPVVFSHSNPWKMINNPRNISDESIKACAEKGGVIGVSTWAPLLFQKGDTKWPNIEKFIDMVDYIAQLTGSVDHIGIGTDFHLGTYDIRASDPWGVPEYPDPQKFANYNTLVNADVRSPKQGLEDYNDYCQITSVIERLNNRGYSSSDIAKILGENYIRVFSKVWK